ncbi:MAG: DUF1614 domain-containing protein, partial [Planctomycetes bacterium]|nr:DUF1614 domain-containing protein [Planctomycetota bacterium]
MPQRVPFGCLALAVIMGMLVIFPLLLADLALHALAKLGLTGPVSLLVILGVLFGGFINIPVKKIPREEKIQVPRIALFGIGQFLPSLVTRRTYTIIAVNLGGCIIPTGIAIYELWRLGLEGTGFSSP